MPMTIPDFWSDDIKVDVLPPIAILKAQEGVLARKTQGMLQAKLSSTERGTLVQHHLDLIAPGLNFYRERLLAATHDREKLYPVVVTAESFAPDRLNPMEQVIIAVQRSEYPSVTQRRAATDEEFIRLVQDVLRSGEVRALIHLLIARINELRAAEQPAEATKQKPDSPSPAETPDDGTGQK